MNVLMQILAVTRMNVSSLPQRLGGSIVVIVGIAGVVGVLVSVIAMSGALSGVMLSTGRADRVVVLSSGANFEVGSSLTTADARTVLSGPGIARDEGGELLASAELVTAISAVRGDDGASSGVMIRGVQPAGLALRDEFRLVEGRLFEPGLRELIVGRSARAEFDGLEPGDDVELRDGPWRIVGVFTSDGTAFESSLVADSSTLQSGFQRNSFNAVRVRLESEESIQAFSDSLTTNPGLSVDVIPEPEYYARAAENLEPLFSVITNVVGSIMALGALFAALNTMYSSVSSRTTEIGTLRAIGFGSGGVVVSVLAEALLLAVLGAVIGAAAAWLLFNGNSISIGGNTGSLVAEMRITASALGGGVLWACGVGLLGGLFPAIRAARLPVAEAVRAI